MSPIVRLNLAHGRVDLRTRCTELKSRISNGHVYGVALIRFHRPRSFICALECIGEGILLILVCASGMAWRLQLNSKIRL
jgi:hypothetical protein